MDNYLNYQIHNHPKPVLFRIRWVINRLSVLSLICKHLKSQLLRNTSKMRKLIGNYLNCLDQINATSTTFLTNWIQKTRNCNYGIPTLSQIELKGLYC